MITFTFPDISQSFPAPEQITNLVEKWKAVSEIEGKNPPEISLLLLPPGFKLNAEKGKSQVKVKAAQRVAVEKYKAFALASLLSAPDRVGRGDNEESAFQDLLALLVHDFNFFSAVKENELTSDAAQFKRQLETFLG